MQRKPNNTREQCAFDSGAFRAKETKRTGQVLDAELQRALREGRNPHKKGSVEYQFWNDGFDSV